FALSADGERIRANQGHSVDVDLQLAPAAPPATLFHGTVDAAIASIRAQGLLRGERHHVHLSSDIATASKVGGRRGKPVILTVRSGAMAAAGHVFYCSANGVWLTDHVPPEFIDFEPPAARSDRRLNQLGRISVAEQTVAAIEAGRYVNARHQVVEIAALVAAAAEG